MIGTLVLAAQASAQPSVAMQRPPDPPSQQSLAMLVEAAERHYPQLRADEAAMRAAEARLDEIRFSPFFQIQADAGFAVAPQASGTPIFSNQDQLPLDNGWGPAASFRVRTVIPLYTGGRIVAARRAGRAGVRAAQQQRERSVARLRFDVRRAYFGLQLALDVDQMIAEGIGKLERAVAKLDREIEEGEGDPIDRYRLAAGLAEIRARQSENARLRESSEAALRVLTGVREIAISDCPSAPLALPETELTELLARSANRPELGQLAAGIEAREQGLRAARGGFAPMIGLGLNAGRQWAPGITDIENPYIQDRANGQALGFGLVLRWNLDFVGQTFRMRRAEAQLEQVREQARLARAGIELEVELAYEAWLDAQRREEAWAEGERQTRAWVVTATQAMDIGTVPARDLMDALRGYFQARFEHLRTVQQLNTALADLERVTGSQVFPPDAWEVDCE